MLFLIKNSIIIYNSILNLILCRKKNDKKTLLKLVVVLLIKPFGLLISFNLFHSGILILLKDELELKTLLKRNSLRKFIQQGLMLMDKFL